MKGNSTGLQSGGLLWAYASSFIALGARVAGFVVLARLLAPQDFGLMGMALALVGFLELFKDAGLGEALLQDRREAKAIADSVFWSHLVVGAAIAIVLWLLAPLAAAYYQRDEVIGLLRALGLLFLIYPFSDVPLNLLLRELKFRALFFRHATPALVWVAVSVTLAWMGFGVWSLVTGQLVAAVATAIVAWNLVRWRPRWRWQWAALASVYGFGAQVSAQNFFGWIISWLDEVFAGRYLGARSLGFYRVSRLIGSAPWLMVAGPFNTVFYPELCRSGGDLKEVKRQYLASLRWILLASLSLGIALFFLVPMVVEVLLGPQWREAIPVLRLMALAGIHASVLALSPQVYKALGRPQIATRFFMVQTAICLPGYYFAAQHSIVALAGVHVALAALVWPADIAIAMRVLGLTAGEVFAAMKEGLLLAIVLALAGVAGQWATASLGLSEPRAGLLLLLVFVLVALMVLRALGLWAHLLNAIAASPPAVGGGRG
ncbi:MAG: oligosaccharide flippase family protein, partial [Candidatus Acidiferrales bacterium]